MIVSPWNENIITRVKSNPPIVVLLNFVINFVLKYSSPFLFITFRLVIIPPARGITTKRTTESIRVSQGISIPPMPKRNATIGVKAIKIIRSFVATWTTV